MIIVFDIGNSNIVMGVYKKDIIIHHWRISTDKGKTADEYGMIVDGLFRYANLKMNKIKSVVISSVVPTINVPIQRMVQRYFNLEPFFVDHTVKLGIKECDNTYDPKGSDLICGAVAAYKKYGGPTIIIDFGTATTFFAIDNEGKFLGGAIVPGIGISADALFEKTAKLPKVEVLRPKSIINLDTIGAIQAGIFYGIVGQVDEVVRRIKNELKKKAKVIATGGFVNLIKKESSTIEFVDPFLVLDGAKLIYEANL